MNNEITSVDEIVRTNSDIIDKPIKEASIVEGELRKTENELKSTLEKL